MWPFKKKEPENETRSTGTGYTTQVMQARADYIGGVNGVAELTGCVQGCVTCSRPLFWALLVAPWRCVVRLCS